MAVIIGTAWCAKCSKPVDKMDSIFNHMTSDYIFTVYCHGETEQTVLNVSDIVNAVSIDCTVAFKDGK